MASVHRQNLLELLMRHRPFDQAEAEALAHTLTFVRANPSCFDRSLRMGHITGSAWLLDPSGERVLLTHHKKLNKWIQLGGHADGNPDVSAVALAEAKEESGLDQIELVFNEVFDVDVHPIPAHADQPPHDHYDVRFLCRVYGDTAFRVSDESHALAWVEQDRVPQLDVDDSVLRMQRKWLELSANGYRIRLR